MKLNVAPVLSIQVGQWLRSRGYHLADHIGLELQSLEKTNSLGLLRENPDVKPRSWLMSLIRGRSRKIFFGVVWFEDVQRKADEQNWVLEVYGQENAYLARQLAHDMTLTFSVKVVFRIISEDTKTEVFGSDFSEF